MNDEYLSSSVEAVGPKDKFPIAAGEEKAMQHLQRAQWLRAAILGANDGLLSTASLMLGIGAAREDQESMIISGVAGALAGACSMAVGEFVSVSTQRDIEKSLIRKCSSDTEFSKEVGDIDNIKLQISASADPPVAESRETETNSNSGITAVLPTPSRTPLENLMPCDHDSFQGKNSPSIQQIQLSPYVASPSRSAYMKGRVSDHVRANVLQNSINQDDRNDDALPNPYKAAAASAVSFLCGSLVPIVPAMVFVPKRTRTVFIIVVTSIALALFGALGALLGGSQIRRSAMRVLFGGWISMAITYGLLMAFDRDYVHVNGG